MGHGTRSALIVSILRTLIAELSRRGRNAPHFLRELNNNFCAMLKTLPSPFFASASYFVADTTSRVANYAFAGHPPPFYLHRATGRVTRLEIPKPQGAAMGLIPHEEYGGGHRAPESGRRLPVLHRRRVRGGQPQRGGNRPGPHRENPAHPRLPAARPEILDAIVKGIHEFADGEPDRGRHLPRSWWTSPPEWPSGRDGAQSEFLNSKSPTQRFYRSSRPSRTRTSCSSMPNSSR
jgi:hypothetical protein